MRVCFGNSSRPPRGERYGTVAGFNSGDVSSDVSSIHYGPRTSLSTLPLHFSLSSSPSYRPQRGEVSCLGAHSKLAMEEARLKHLRSDPATCSENVHLLLLSVIPLTSLTLTPHSSFYFSEAGLLSQTRSRPSHRPQRLLGRLERFLKMEPGHNDTGSSWSWRRAWYPHIPECPLHQPL